MIQVHQVCSNYDPGAKNGPVPRGHMFYTMKKIFLYETTNHRALIFDMKYNLVDLYQLCSSYTPGAKNVPASVVT